MAEKKRKVSSTVPAQAAKKVKKSSKPEVTDVAAPKDVVETDSKDAPTPAKKPRKRAADFLDDEPEATPPKKGKKAVAGSKQEPASLTADGTNGVVEHTDNEEITITTSKKPKKQSMMAEAERTQDQELADEFGKDDAGSEDEEIDSAPALLTGFDSDNDDTAEDKNFDASRVAPIPQFKKTSKKLRQAKDKKSEGPGVVYVGRVPHGFYESQMREYFEQFGTIARLRLSRNKKTGASKHFAFIEFESDEVAKIVAETMDNYLMFGHILKCKYAEPESLHEDVWKGANKKFRRIPHHKLAKERAEAPKSEEQIAKKMGKEQKKRKAKKEKMKELGYEYDLPHLKKPEVGGLAEVEDTKEEEPLAIEDIKEKVEGAIVPPPNVPKDELAVKVEEKVKKAKKAKKDKKTEAALPPTEDASTTVEVTTSKKKKTKKAKDDDAEGITAKNVLSENQPDVKEDKVKPVTLNGKKEPAKKDGKKLKSILKTPKAKKGTS